MIENEMPINGQGSRLVQRAEEINVPLLKPWEVEGEKEILKGSKTLKSVEVVELRLSQVYEHTQICKDPCCGSIEAFKTIMRFRQEHCLPLLKEGNIAMYEALYALLVVYLLANGDERLYIEAVFAGLSLSADLISKLR
jgi:hypothetical protein